jgi:hypothetical protein
MPQDTAHLAALFSYLLDTTLALTTMLRTAAVVNWLVQCFGTFDPGAR